MNKIRTIAIVDDHLMFRKGLVALINLFSGYQVVFDAGSGNECIRIFTDNDSPDPDILLMDIAMPGMEGYEATAWVRDNRPDVRVLALSTMEAETAIIGMIRSGAKGYILKDADPSELKKAFDEVMSVGYYYNDLVSRKVLRSAHLIGAEKHPPTLQGRLSQRETDFLQLVCSEKTYVQIAGEMFVSERTVDGYRDALFRKLEISSRVGLVLYAIRNGIVRL